MKAILFVAGLLFFVALFSSGNPSIAANGINIAPENVPTVVYLIGMVILVGAIGFAIVRTRGLALVLLVIMAVIVTAARGGKMPWQP